MQGSDSSSNNLGWNTGIQIELCVIVLLPMVNYYVIREPNKVIQ